MVLLKAYIMFASPNKEPFPTVQFIHDKQKILAAGVRVRLGNNNSLYHS